ncbi:MAG: hypothetical protein US50_C0017G0005 [Candidatus Nomurabacteria bacterium GW2011_GWB1_37_5]|uniref:Uncharacterized protein n=1 Tax=Candidatus Nomurabacteria bacterium GW2011_GWB1_37_5 TaxID=1618742 RepID=A0A0G0JF00_9BACT|nr:MAG: hypothetical protein US50_C0017G0005 [Candidatus Nomurabacteria bacterium GW2011_GWB1_37_5]
MKRNIFGEIAVVLVMLGIVFLIALSFSGGADYNTPSQYDEIGPRTIYP